MTKNIRFGILSFAMYHANFWAESINNLSTATLIGIWDDNSERGKDAADRYNTRFYPNLAELLGACDAVGITSETARHVDLVKEAAGAGVHVINEKPMATTLEDCDRIQQAVEAAGITFMQNFPKRYDPINHELVELVQSGQLGQITLVRIRHGHFHGLDQEFLKQWYTNPALSGGGTLLDEGVHAADFLLWLLGEPEQVSATLAYNLNLAVDDTAVAIFSYKSGILAEISASWTFLASEQSIEVFGTKGSAILSGVDLASRDFSKLPYLKLFLHDNERGVWKGSETIPNFKQGNFHQQGPAYFVDCLLNGKDPAVTAAEGKKSLQMILTAYQAAKTGQSQKIVF